MKTVEIRGLKLGEGRPKVCVPIVGTTAEEILAEGAKIAALRGRGADLCEWRIDWFEDVFDDAALQATGQALAAALQGMPLLCTFRTRGEGGSRDCCAESYTALVLRLCGMGFADLVDIELFIGDEPVERMRRAAAENGVVTVFSNHEFHRTPPKDEIVTRLTRMEELGADLCKIAVMPQCQADVLTLLSATLERSAVSCRPLITMSMGALGAVSRLCGELTGSCLSFGSLSRASAPGQIPAPQLAEVLQLLAL